MKKGKKPDLVIRKDLDRGSGWRLFFKVGTTLYPARSLLTTAPFDTEGDAKRWAMDNFGRDATRIPS